MQRTASLIAALPLLICGVASAQTLPGYYTTEYARITPEDGAIGDQFGRRLIWSGDTLAVGAPWADQAELVDTGSVYVFDTTTNTQIAKFSAEVPQEFAYFGRSIAVLGQTLYIGAPDEDHSGLRDAGAVYVFDIESGVLLERLTADEPSDTGRFGYSIDVSDDRLLIGAAFHSDPGGHRHAGTAYLYDSHSLGLIARIFHPDPSNTSWFGHGVHLANGTAIIGSPRWSQPGLSSLLGKVFVFDSTDGTYLHAIDAPNQGFGESFASRLHVSGESLFAGVPNATSYGQGIGYGDGGTVYEFNAATGAYLGEYQQTNVHHWANVGRSIDADGSFLVAGAPNEEVGGAVGGAAYIFNTETGQQIAGLASSAFNTDRFFGASVAMRGTTVAVGASLGNGPGSVLFFEFDPCPVDLAEPERVLDAADIQAFVDEFLSGGQGADLYYEGSGVLDLTDIVAFGTAFQAGCP